MDVLNYTLAAVLLLASVPLYQVIIEHRDEPERRPVQLQQPVAVARVSASLPGRFPDTSDPVNAVSCMHGFLAEMTPDGPRAVVRHGQLAQCDIHLATPSEARKVSSAGPSDQ